MDAEVLSRLPPFAAILFPHRLYFSSMRCHQNLDVLVLILNKLIKPLRHYIIHMDSARDHSRYTFELAYSML